jgi:hypothetical protein
MPVPWSCSPIATRLRGFSRSGALVRLSQSQDDGDLQGLGIEAAAESVRYTKLLRLDSKVEELVPGLPVARTISRAGNSLLRLRSTLSRSTDFQVEPYNGVFGEEFDWLNSSSVEAGWIHGQRTAAFLNWRFRDCPLSEHVAVTARRAGLLLGYAIATIAGTQATLGDIRTSMSKAFGALLNGMEDVLRDKGIHTWNTPLFAGPDVANSVRHAGFHPRESSPVVFGDGGHSQWLLLASDRDS